ncbi:MAG: hypothetical protein OXN17_15550 [Candidatus Poribacteria bacterium]|nr:hypothetical protein [Candidatus Poribacteria bacterium]MDE0504468.1 hypothetical protein [Candidatus Poribacteria bacterium]
MKILRVTYPVLIFAALTCGVSAQQVNVTVPATVDIFLKQLARSEHQGMESSFVGGNIGAHALNGNPAGLSLIHDDRFSLYTARFPRTIAVVSHQNETERYEDYGEYDLYASGVELLNYAAPIRSIGIIGFDFARGHDGQFSRVDYLGKATNNFPQSDWALGVGFSRNLFAGLAFGVDAKWLRSKIQLPENEEHAGHGYAYSLGLSQKIGEQLRIGGVVRNLSNGLSFSDDTIPDQIEQDVLVGGVYYQRHRDLDLKLSLDANPPFKNGVRASLGAEIWYMGRIGCRIGYLRHTEHRWQPVQIIRSETLQMEERIWKTEGPTFGIGFNLGRVRISGAYTPQAKPTAKDGERIRVDQGGVAYYFSIGQGS